MLPVWKKSRILVILQATTFIITEIFKNLDHLSCCKTHPRRYCRNNIMKSTINSKYDTLHKDLFKVYNMHY